MKFSFSKGQLSKISKYKAKKIIIDAITFHSQKEGKKYIEYENLRKSGEILFFLMQVPFHLPGGVKYILDFLIFWANGEVTFVDVKGMKTAIYILKKKQVEDLYKIKIEEV